jgi:hypothetical protein
LERVTTVECGFICCADHLEHCRFAGLERCRGCFVFFCRRHQKQHTCSEQAALRESAEEPVRAID